MPGHNYKIMSELSYIGGPNDIPLVDENWLENSQEMRRKGLGTLLFQHYKEPD